jgi:uncharacterized membrane protein SirB2
MNYLSLEHFHIGCAALSGALLLASVALKRGRTKGQRQAAFAAALALFAYIVTVAVTKRPFPFY